jgi:hypothetical protein
MLQYFVQVPLFQHMDELVLENICDRVKSLVFTKGETVSSKLHHRLCEKNKGRVNDNYPNKET